MSRAVIVETAPSEPLTVSTGTLDLVRQVFRPHGGGQVRLSARETALLRDLADHAPEAVDRDELRMRVWGHHRRSLSRAVDATVARLRRKIERDDAPPILVTVHGHGYRLALGEEPPAPESEVPPRPPLVLGRRTVDLLTGTVTGPAGPTALTAHERFLLDLLFQADGGWVSGERIERMLGVGRGRTRASSLVYRLRQKIEDDPSSPRQLVSRRGCGYRLTVAPPSSSPAQQARLDALRQLARHVGELLDYGDCVVYARSGSGFRQVAAWGDKLADDGSVRAPLCQHAGEGIVGACIERADVVRVSDTRDDPRYLPDLVPARSELAAPIVAAGVVVGVLDSESPSPDRYALQDEIVFLSLAAIAASSFTLSDVPHDRSHR